MRNKGRSRQTTRNRCLRNADGSGSRGRSKIPIQKQKTERRQRSDKSRRAARDRFLKSRRRFKQKSVSNHSDKSRCCQSSTDGSRQKKNRKWKHVTNKCGSRPRKQNNITIGVSKKCDGKRVRDKKQVCFICRSTVLWLSRHLERCHRDNFLVAQVLAKKGQERKDGLKRLRNLGSFKHNIDVLNKGSGELLVTRRTNGKHKPESYLPCTKCYGFFYHHDLWRHKCPCLGRKNNSEGAVPEKSNTSSDCVESSRSLLEGALDSENSNAHIDRNLNKRVLSHMRRDPNSKVVMTDTLILKFGAAQLKRIGIKGRRRIATRMRLLARLLSVLQKALDLHNTSLSHFLNGMYFDAVVEGIENMCGLHFDDHGQRCFETPSIALNLGNILSKVCHIKKGIAIRLGDDEILKEVDSFLALLKNEYSDSMSCPALATLKSKNVNQAVELPKTEDLLKLKTHAEKKIHDLTKQLQTQPDYNAWRQLSEVVLTRLVIFNKRRASEPAKLLLSQYLSRPDWQHSSNQELVQHLQPLEQKMMNRMDLIQVSGKRNRLVPILITPEVGKAMKALASTRSRCGIPPQNQYFFATRSNDGYLNTWLVLHNHAIDAGVSKPALITSCRLRKYVATLSQVNTAYILNKLSIFACSLF